MRRQPDINQQNKKQLHYLLWHFKHLKLLLRTTPKLIFPAQLSKEQSDISCGTRYLSDSTYTQFSKHVSLQLLNPLHDYETKSPPDPPKNWLLKALFMSGLWGESNRPKDRVDRGFSTCYHWATHQRILLGKDWINPPARLINWNQWCQGRRRRRENQDAGWDRWLPRS